MEMPQLEFFDIEKLIRNINAHLRNRGELIELGNFEDKTSEKNHFLYSFLDNRVVERRGEFPLWQSLDGYGIWKGFFGIDSDVRVGHISVEKGVYECKDPRENEIYGGRYEALRLRLKPKRIMRLRDGRIMPSCSVKLTLIERNGFSELLKYRNDHERRCLVSFRSDLEELLPSEWFYSKRVQRKVKLGLVH